MQYAKDAFTALGVKTDPIDIIGGLEESDFPTNEVRKLEELIKEEYRAYVSCLQQQQQQQQQHLEGITSAMNAMKLKVEVIPTRDEIAKMLEETMKDLKQALAQDKPGRYTYCPFRPNKYV